ncbi:MAG: molecular chaperone HtpG [Defluviitaleaceae bacterium]|nr:molecular chaperone HtpG [Defluviitaleaceae bacterium]
MENIEKGTLSINSENIMPIIKKWLYSDTDIFFRELISNACDAVNKLKKLAELGEAHIDEQNFAIIVQIDKKNKTIKIIDNGIGMTKDEINRYINQIAFSGASDFVEKYKESLDGKEIIGHFGLGFYSAFMVSSKVMIDTKSYKEEPAATWVSDGTTEYEIKDSNKTTRGTEITLFIDEENEDFLMEYKTREILNKYCSFMPVEIFIEVIKENEDNKKEEENEKPINKIPLWVKNPKDCTDEEYKDFYKETFNDFNDPLFWIHLNMDYPFSLKGILYFPKLKHEFEQSEGQVKLFCNQVFVADNVKEVIPEFLLLLKGVLDCPDIPLNVSRSFLQNDTNVSKMSSYVSKKVADRLNSIYKKEKENYVKYWSDISPFIKYGCIREKNFYEKMEPAIIYKTTKDEYVTLDEYLEKNKEKHENTVYYVNNVNQQSRYIKMFKDENMEAVILTTNLDSPFISYLESYKIGVKFNRIDSNLSELKEENTDESQHENIINIFKNVIGEKIKYKVEALKSKSVPAIIILDENNRRMMEMSKMFNREVVMPVEEELVLNSNNELIQLLLKKQDNKEETDIIINHIYDLARFGQNPLSEVDMNNFIDRNNKLLEIVLKQ